MEAKAISCPFEKLITRVGGLCDTILKSEGKTYEPRAPKRRQTALHEKGARFVIPSASTEDTKAIGRGAYASKSEHVRLELHKKSHDTLEQARQHLALLAPISRQRLTDIRSLYMFPAGADAGSISDHVESSTVGHGKLLAPPPKVQVGLGVWPASVNGLRACRLRFTCVVTHFWTDSNGGRLCST